MKRTTTAAEKRHMQRVAALGLLIDNEDLHLLEGQAFYIDTCGYVTVAVTRKNKARLHSLIMKPESGLEVDHINGNRIDNRRSNLRICTHADNCKNSGLRSNNKTGVRGVWFDSIRCLWTSQITTNGKRISLGRFKDFESAVNSRIAAEIKFWGEFRRETNFN